MIYLDNCSTTNKKPHCVIKAFVNGIKKYSVNPGRGSYDLSVKAGIEVLKLRQKASEFFGCNSVENVIITKNCTESLNLILRGSVIPNGHIIVSAFEHNSVLRTLSYLREKYNVSFSIIYPKNQDGKITIEEIKKEVRVNTYMVFINHTSNVFGVTQDIEKIGKFCNDNKLLFGVDTAQSAGHEKIDMAKYNINFISVAGHKGLMGSQGIGLMLFRNTNINPLIFGGTGTNSESIIQPTSSPDGFESGTLNIPAILSLSAGIDFNKRHFDKIQKKIKKLTDYLLKKLKTISNVRYYCSNASSGVVAFEIQNIANEKVCGILNEDFSICVRSGLHCAPLVHKFLHTEKNGLIRVGIGYYNSLKDIKNLIQALELISNGYY